MRQPEGAEWLRQGRPEQRETSASLIGFATARHTSTGNRSSRRWEAIAVGGLVLRDDARTRAHVVAVVFDTYLRAAGARPELLS